MSVKAKSKKRLVILVAAVLGTGVVGGGLVLYKMHRTSVHYTEARVTGLRAAGTGDHVTAVNHLAYYLDRHPDDVEALETYAKEVLASDGLEAGQSVAAVARVRHLAQLRPAEIEPKRQLMRLQARLGRSTEAREAADAVLAQDSKDVEALGIRVGVLVALREWDNALAAAKIWCEAAPQDPVPHCNLLMIMARMDKPADEIKASAKLVADKAPGTPLALLVTAHALALTHDVRGSQEVGKALAVLTMPSVEFAKAVIDELNGIGLTDASLQVLRRTAKESNDADIHRALTCRLWEARQYDEVLSLTETLPAHSSPELLAFRATSLTSVRKASEADAAVAELKSRKNDPVAAAWALIATELQKPGSVDPSALRKACDDGVRYDRRSPYLRYFRGVALAQLDETDLAIEDWHAAAQLSPTWVAPLLRSSDATLSRGRFAVALKDAQGANVRADGHDGAAFVNFVRVLGAAAEAGEADAGEALNYIEQVRAQLPKDETTMVAHISLLAHLGRRPEAMAEVRKGLAMTPPPSNQTLLRLAAISQRRQLGLEDDCIALADRSSGGTVEAAYARAAQKAQQGATADGLALLRAARQKAPNQGVGVEWDVAEARYMERIQDGGAKAAWQKIAESNPSDRRVQQFVLNSRAAHEDKAFADRTIERLRELTGDNSLGWRIARARWRLQWAANDQERAEAAVFIKEITRTAPDVLEPRILLAQAYERLGKIPESIEQLQVALTLDQSNAQVALALAQLLQSRKEYGKAQELLDRVVKSKSGTADQKRMAATLLAQQGDSAKAIEVLEGNKENTLFLATLYRQRNELSKAEAVVKELLAAKPDGPTVAFAADLYGQLGRRDDADKALAMLDKVGLRPGMKELTLAEHAARYQGVGQAEKWYKEATKVAPADGTVWRAMAGFYAFGGRVKEFSETLDAGAKSAGGDAGLKVVLDQRDVLGKAIANPEVRVIAAAFIASPQSDSPLLAAVTAVVRGADPVAVAAELKSLAERANQSLPVQILAARAAARAGRNDEAADLAAKAVQAFPNEADPCQVAVEVFSKTERWSEALGFARTWRERSAARPLAADMQIANLLLRLKQPDQAVEQLKPHLAAAVQNPDSGSAVIFQYVAAMSAAGRAAEAADVAWPLAAKSGDWQKIWMQLALRCDDRTAEQWLRRVTPVIKAEEIDEHAVLAGAWHMLYSRTKDPAHLKLANDVFDEVMSHKDLPATTIMARGLVAEQDGDLKTAEAAYRRALALDPALPVARNNLAMILSSRPADLPEAQKLAEANVQANPQIAVFVDTLAVIQSKLKRYDAAVATLKQALALEPRSVDWRTHLAQVYFDSNRRKDADDMVLEISALMVNRDEPVSQETKAQLEKLKADLAKEANTAAEPTH
jgi:tetratricopeptide (TPR) repeat protein